MKKWCLALVMVVAMAGSAWAEEKDEEDAFINNVILITVDDEDMDGKVLETIIKGIVTKVSTPAILGPAVKKISISTMSSITLSEIYRMQEYPQILEYKRDVSSLYSELRTIKMSEDFAKQGIAAANARAWLKKCKAKDKQYAKVKLPPMRDEGFMHLDSLLCEYGMMRKGLVSLPQLHQHEEMIAIHRGYIEKINNMVTDD